MNVDDLRSVLRTERQKDSLQHLRESFYEDVAEFIAEQKATRERKAEQLGTHYSPEIRRLTDEIETAEEVVTSIYERRVGKVVKAASFAAAGMTSETDGLTREEKRLFDDLVARIEENRGTVLSALEDVSAADSPRGDVAATDVTTAEPDAPGDSGPAIPPDDPDPETAPTGPGTDASAPEAVTGDSAAGDVLADAMGGGTGGDASNAQSTPQPDADRPATEVAAVSGESGPSDSDAANSGSADSDPAIPPDDPDPETAAPPAGDTDTVEPSADDPLSGLADERETVRITADVGTILGVDEREYDLATEDVVTLPAANADPLVERGAAERLD
ncbi:DNA replication protein [Haloferax sp. Atlit-47N]|uniref:DNA replication protein n=1 Tax=Haloferax sp. Atlit-48N TaxID=2077198 RepID=A0ACD5HSW7_9EURY|nr:MULTISPECIES: DNA replication protein [unclassified Haloferax]RDZ31705.1 DNA replication protein [Haloferax sp. Atlit-48N]RDZ36305.1 DNA replication protein [Haloferax sp. Atlit-47N]